MSYVKGRRRWQGERKGKGRNDGRAMHKVVDMCNRVTETKVARATRRNMARAYTTDRG